jgi:hypothetical protein
MRLYALEGLLARLAISRHSTQLILKGGVLLAAYATRRATRDIDLAEALPSAVAGLARFKAGMAA